MRKPLVVRSLESGHEVIIGLNSGMVAGLSKEDLLLFGI